MNYNDIYHEDLMQKGFLSEALPAYSIDFDADTYTIADIEALPENIRMELLDGKMYYMASPLTIHQRILVDLIMRIRSYINSSNGSCEVLPAPFGVYIADDDRNYVEPDISVICDPNKIEERGCHGAPDWIIEIVSPSSRRMDYHLKLFKYRSCGVREYWIVDPHKKMVSVHNFFTDESFEYTFFDTVKVNLYEDLSIDFSKIRL